MQTIKFSFTKLIFISIIFIITDVYKCNVWDNIISQLSSPQYSIPNEIRLELFNQDNKAMEIFISSNFNLIKFSLINEDLVNAFTIPNNTTSSVADVYLNFTNGTIKIDFDDSCYYKNISSITKLTTKFILFSYDVLTYFHETAEFYEYIYTNPLQQNLVNNINKSKFTLDDAILAEKASDIKLNEQITPIDSLNKLISSANIFEKESMVVFKVNKSKALLEQIAFKYKNIELTEFDVRAYKVDTFDANVFKIGHECKLLEDKDIDETKLRDKDSKQESDKFLSLIE